MTNANAKQSHMRNDASHEKQAKTNSIASRLKKTLLALCLLAATQLAWGQDPITVTHSTNGTVGAYTDLGAAICACTSTTGTYTITVSGPAGLSTKGTVNYSVTINLVSSVANTQQTITKTKPDVYIKVDGGSLTMTDIVLHGDNITNTSNAITPNGSGGVKCYMLIQTYSPGNLTMNNCTVRNGMSGGIYFDGDSLSITNSRIENNKAAQGGGLYIKGSTGTCKLTNTTISNNTAIGTGKHGGGIYCEVDLECDGATISNNTSETNGGGIYQTNGKLTCKNNTSISNNRAGYSGGGIYLLEGDLDCQSTTIIGNQAINNHGGGVYAGASEYSKDLRTTYSISFDNNTKIKENHADEYGGGIFSYGVDLTLDGTSVNSNVAKQCGGGIYFKCGVGLSELVIKNSAKVNYNQVFRTDNDNKKTYGGGIYYEHVETSQVCFTINDSEVCHNNCFAPNKTSVGNIWGGGIYVEKGHLTITDSKVNNNAAKHKGGGIYQAAGNLTIIGTEGLGENQKHSEVNYNNSTAFTVDGNSYYAELVGAGIDFPGTGTLSITKTQVNGNGHTDPDNSYAGMGVGIHIYTEASNTTNTATITDSEIKDNKAANGNSYRGGCGVLVGEYTTFTMTNTTVEDNSFNTHSDLITNDYSLGVGISIFSDNATLSNCTITGNQGNYEYGGGIYYSAYSSSGTLTMNGCTITQNKLSDSHSRGGGLYVDAGTAALTNCTIGGRAADANSAGMGGGIYVEKKSLNYYATAQLKGNGNIIQNNTATEKAGGVYKDGSLKVEGTPTITNNKAGTAKAVVEENVYIPVNSADGQTILITGELACDSKIGVTKTKKWSGAPEYGDINGDGTVNASDNGDHSYNDDDNFNEVRTAIAKVSPTNTSESWANDTFKRDVFFDDKKNYGVWSFNYSNSNDDTKAYSDQCDYFIETWRCYASNASTDVATSKGNVTQVKTAAGLAYLSNHVNGLNGMTANDYSGQWIDQTADLNLGGHYWEPIGYSTGDECGLSNTFQGNYDGRGHIITNATSILPVTDMGLFGTVKNGTVMRTFNLAHDFTLTSTESPGMGGIAGRMNATGAALMDGCEAAGTLTRYAPSAKGNRDATHTIGGLVGLASANEAPAPGGGGNTKDGATGGTLEVRNSFATTTINGNDSSIAGGLVGSLDCQNGSAKLANSYSVPTITGGTNTGSLVGMANLSTITNCYTQNQALNLIGAIDGTITTENLFKPEGALKQEPYTETYKPTIGADYLGYMRADNCITGTESPLFVRLNTWVNKQNGGADAVGDYARWARPALAYYGEKNTGGDRFDTIIKPINADLPVLRLCESSKRDVGTTDGLPHATKASNATPKYYQGGFRAVGTYGGPGTVLQYGGPDRDPDNGVFKEGMAGALKRPQEGSKKDHLFIYGDITEAIAIVNSEYFITNIKTIRNMITQEKVSIYQHAAVLNPNELACFAETYVGVEVDKGGSGISSVGINDMAEQNLKRSWHMISTPLLNAPIGFDYKNTNNGKYSGPDYEPNKEPTYDASYSNNPAAPATPPANTTHASADQASGSYITGQYEYWNNPWHNGGEAYAGCHGGIEFHWLGNTTSNGNNRYWMAGWTNSQDLNGNIGIYPYNTDNGTTGADGIKTYNAWADGYMPSNLSDLHSYNHDPVPNTDEVGRYPYGMDFYSWYEPTQHYVNFKRNGPNHWHSDAHPSSGWHFHMDYTPEDNFNHGFVNSNYLYQNSLENYKENENEGALIPGKGYMMSISVMTLLQSHGYLNHWSDFSLYPTYSDNNIGIEPGYNLVGNPYHGYYDLSKLGYGVTVIEANKFKVWPQGGSSGGAYANQYQHPHQAFFVKVDSEGNSLHFYRENVVSRHDAGKYSDNTMNLRGTERDDTRPAYPLVNLFLSSAKGCDDVCVVEFNRPEHGGAEKMKQLYSGNGLMFAKHDDKSYAALFATEETRRVPLQFVSKDEEGDTYTLSWTTANADFEKLILVDNMTGVQYDMLANTSYSFSGKKGDYWSRFYITFEVTGVDEQEEADDDASSGAVSFAFFDGSQWVVTNTAATGATTLDLIDLQGRVLHHTTLGNDGQTRLSLPDVAKGMYLLRMTNRNGTQVQKIVVN